MSRANRSAMAKFRSGVAPIRLETGRYENPTVPEHLRFCPFCDGTVETECHVIVNCAMYCDLREDLFYKCNNVDTFFNNMSDTEKMCFILSNEKIAYSSAKTLKLMLQRWRTVLYR